MASSQHLSLHEYEYWYNFFTCVHCISCLPNANSEVSTIYKYLSKANLQWQTKRMMLLTGRQDAIRPSVSLVISIFLSLTWLLFHSPYSSWGHMWSQNWHFVLLLLLLENCAPACEETWTSTHMYVYMCTCFAHEFKVILKGNFNKYCLGHRHLFEQSPQSHYQQSLPKEQHSPHTASVNLCFHQSSGPKESYTLLLHII